MLSRGIHATADFFKPVFVLIDRINSVPVDWKLKPIYNIVFALSFSIISSAFLPDGFTVICILLSAALLWYLMKDAQTSIFEQSQTQVYLFIATPIYALFVAWGLLVVELGRPEQIGQFIGTMFSLVLVSVFPIWRRKKNWDVKERKIPFTSIYLLFAFFVVIQQGFILKRLLS